MHPYIPHEFRLQAHLAYCILKLNTEMLGIFDGGKEDSIAVSIFVNRETAMLSRGK